MNTFKRLITVGFALAAVACGDAAAKPNAELERDLEQTKLSEFELANQNAKRTDVVSAAERIPTSTRTTTQRRPAPQTNPEGTMKAPTQVSSAEPPVDTSLTAPRPRSTPQTQQRHGPYKTVGEIIRNAPFPINP